MTQRPEQSSPALDELLTQAQQSQAEIAALLPRVHRAAGLSPDQVAAAVAAADRHPQKSKLARDARRALDRLLPPAPRNLRPGDGLLRLPGLKA